MIGAETSRPSAAGRSPRPRWAWAPALAGIGIVLVTVAACGGGGNSATPAATVATSAAPSGSPTPTAAPSAFPGVVGTAAAVSGSSMEVQNPTSGQVTVTFTAATPITETVTVTAKDVTVGSCVTVIAQSPAAGTATAPSAAAGAATRSVTAASVTISRPVKGKCTGAGGFGAGGFGGRRGTGSPRPTVSPRPRPTGSRGAFGGGGFGGGGFGGANGKVTSVSASGFVVQGRDPAAGTDASITVTTTTATTYLKTVAAHSSALKVGQCITAVGTANSIGAVAARSIRISQPGPNGCVSGFDGRRGAGRPSSDA